jgi:hypothetical protein
LLSGCLQRGSKITADISEKNYDRPIQADGLQMNPTDNFLDSRGSALGIVLAKSLRMLSEDSILRALGCMQGSPVWSRWGCLWCITMCNSKFGISSFTSPI